MNSVFYLFILFIGGFGQEKISVLMLGNKSDVGNLEIKIVHSIFRLYNSHHSGKDSLLYTIDTVQHFPELFSFTDSLSRSGKTNHVMAISRITKTKKREALYDFSTVYVPSKEVFFTLKEANKTIQWKTKGTRIGFQLRTTQEKSIKRFETLYQITPVPVHTFDDKVELLRQGKIDVALSDNAELWNKPYLKIIEAHPFQHGKGLAILFPKGSELKDQLDKYVRYYIKSKHFHILVRQIYNGDISEYFQRNL